MIVLADVKFAVFGDYDGNAPDTGDLGVFDTKEEAERVVELLEKCKDAGRRLRSCEDDEKAQDELDRIGVIWPFVEGFQWSLNFKVREVLVRSSVKSLALLFWRSSLDRFAVSLNSSVKSVCADVGVKLGEDGDGWDAIEVDVWDNLSEEEREKLRRVRE